ncbi:14 kDa phosphohistidine phosphatase-like [Oppia nitens]|uniref:14 kDa phosphohistidine phosphatase-like n=1 Tax=Oppia nitens TaxID=1686743 RepID=UPI0023D9A195|nr:14 kDa phosphohistidine phosphatase-like [Oppia nitens]
MDEVTDVDIDCGRFKYVLIEVKDPKDANQTKYIVRGYKRAPFHGDIVDEVEPQLRRLKLLSDCVGGGRIQHNADQKTILVFGYSQGYGKADHSIACEILKKRFPDYKEIKWSDEGY